MKEVKQKKIFLAILLVVCILTITGLSFANALDDIIYKATHEGFDAVESMLGLKTTVSAGELITGSDPNKIITLPAGQQFLISVNFRTNGTPVMGAAGCCSNIQLNYNNAIDPVSVQYTFLSKFADLDRIIRGAPHPKQENHCAGGCTSCGGVPGCIRSCVPNCRPFPHTDYIPFTYQKIITVPSNQPDGLTEVKITITASNKNKLNSVVCPIPKSTISGSGTGTVTVKIPVNVYTPLRETFQIKKYKP